jgi:hypothetical protein
MDRAEKKTASAVNPKCSIDEFFGTAWHQYKETIMKAELDLFSAIPSIDITKTYLYTIA